MGYITTNENLYSLTNIDRSMLILNIIKEINVNVHMKVILKIFLRYVDNINFFYPTDSDNTLVYLRNALSANTHPDIVMLLLRRCELQAPEILNYLHACIGNTLHIEFITTHLKYDDVRRKELQKKLYANILPNYIHNNSVHSRRLFRLLVSDSKLSFVELFELLLLPNSYRLEQVSLVDWRNLQGYDDALFKKAICDLFNTEHVLYTSAHELLQIYNVIVRSYAITIKIPTVYVYRLITSMLYSPQHLILFECTNSLDKFRSFLYDACPVVRYLKRRYNLRYRKFILYWRHKSYRPGSKIFTNLQNKYLHTLRHDDDDDDQQLICDPVPLLSSNPDLKQLEHIIYSNVKLDNFIL